MKKLQTEQSEKEIALVKRSVGHSTGGPSPPKTLRLRVMPNSTKNSNRRVAFWAGLRVEGGLRPFGINADELTRWNDKIHNGNICNTSKQ